MKKVKKIFCSVVLMLFLFGCGGVGHVMYNSHGKTKNDLVQKFGPPLEVRKSAEGLETWLYQEAGDEKMWYYTIDNNGNVIKSGYGAR